MNNLSAYIIFLTLTFLAGINGYAQGYLEREDLWVKSIVENMTLDEKIGQIFMLRAFSKGDKNEEKLLLSYIEKYHIGGLCFFQGSLEEQVKLVQKYQNKSKIPLFIALDGEWGLGMRFPKESISYPRQLMLGAIEDNRLIYEMGKEIALQLKKAGVNINFAPAVDINNNPLNPIIHERSFGEDRYNVTSKAYMYMKAMEDNGIMACAKHFPGHGDTDIDSHFDQPIILHKTDRLDEVELFPFRRLSSQSLSAVMVAHLHLPEIDPRPNRPASLSKPIVHDLLRENLAFRGLIFTDAMDMKGVTKYFPSGIAEAEAFTAGNDIILLPQDIKTAFETIKEQILSGKISERRLNDSVYRILRTKYKLGLNATPETEQEKPAVFANRNDALALKYTLTENALTVISDEKNNIPIRKTDNTTFATLSINVVSKSPFQSRVDDFVQARHYQLMPHQLNTFRLSLLNTFSQFDHLIISIHTSGKTKNFDRELPSDLIEFLKSLNPKQQITLILFGSPYLLPKLSLFKNILLCYDKDNITQDVAAQSLFGVNPIRGKLPVTVSSDLVFGHGLVRGSLGRLGYALPEQVGLNSDSLKMIDLIMDEMIKLNAAPGGQVLIAKNGKIVFEKAFGKQSQNGVPVTKETIYDVASVTKILATTFSVMKLVDLKKIDLSKPLNRYIPGIQNTNKSDLIISDILAHHSGLTPWIAFYKSTLPKSKKSGFDPDYYNPILSENYTIPVAEKMFMRTDYRDTIWSRIWNSPVQNADIYKYSDVGFYIMQECVEQITRKKLNTFTDQEIYQPLALRHTGFKPLDQFPSSNIAPTEVDNYWRYQTVKGNVHDMGAAMMGGVSGHAGLFSNAKEMGILMQVLLNKGSYGGYQYFKPETVEMFTSRYYKSSRRGLGFDLKETDLRKTPNMSELASESTFGHLGFTGTAVFADPENNIIYVFTSNRTMGVNGLFNKKEIRPRVQSVIYRSLKKRGASIFT
ncbi:MAG: serine hydrolase [Saprospiraceae bacterium]|nr:serine hydrolase [Saprospiraceae bacterium]